MFVISTSDQHKIVDLHGCLVHFDDEVCSNSVLEFNTLSAAQKWIRASSQFNLVAVNKNSVYF